MQVNQTATRDPEPGEVRSTGHFRRWLKGLVDLYNPRIWKEKGLWWTLGLLAVTVMIVVIVLGIWWSRSPPTFDVRENAQAIADNDGLELVTGSYTTATAIRIGRTLLNKPGGYLSNDVLPPGVYLDNIPNWEFGALTALRDLAAAMRNHLSRSQSQSIEDRDLQVAHPQLNYDTESWILPSTESEYRKGLDAMDRYFRRLSDDKKGDGQFFARADNLTLYLDEVSSRLGSLGNRLGAAAKLTGPGAGAKPTGPDPTEVGAAESTQTQQQTREKTPWLEIDDVFFEARGYAWALLHIMEALQVDFQQVIVDKTATVPMEQIIGQLQLTQSVLWSPLILNGTGFGPMANHSLVMASYIGRANAGIIDLRKLLQQG